MREKTKTFMHKLPMISSLAQRLTAIVRLPKKIRQLDNSLRILDERLNTLESPGGHHGISQQLETLKSIVESLEKNFAEFLPVLQMSKEEREQGFAETLVQKNVSLLSEQRLDTNLSDFTALFENTFRGEEKAIQDKQKPYIKYANDALKACQIGYFLDIGCGRGEFLKLLKSANIPAKGLEINKYRFRQLKNQGLDIVHEDANSFLKTAENNSLIGISAFQVIEHLTIDYLRRFINLAYKKLQANGVIIIETLNSKNVLSLSSFHLDFTHTKLYPPETITFVLQYFGFIDISLIYLSPSPKDFRTNNYPEFNYREYAIIGWKK